MFRTFKKIIAGAIVASFGLAGSLVASTPAHAAITTTYSGFGLNEVARWVGKYEASTTGFSGGNATDATSDGFGTMGILQPSPGATVIAAYLTSAGADHGANEVPAPPTASLNGQAVDFYGKNYAGKWTNFLADVTPIVQNYMTTATGSPETLPWSGTRFNIPVQYQAAQSPWGLPTYSSGLGLTVIFSDPSMTHEASVVFYFGSSDSNGQNLNLNFETLGATPPTGSWLSIGSAWSAGGGQYSTIKIKNSTQANLTDVSGSAGGDDDSYITDGVTPNSGTDTQFGLVTVGGVGDSVDNPTATDPGSPDDELYNMDGFLSAGVSSLTMNTTNPSGDDNIFQAVLSVPFVIFANATFDTQGGSSVPSQYFTDVVTLPAAPTRSGYGFLGWFTAASGGTPLTGSTYTPGALGDVTLYAQWSQDPHNVSYDSQGGSTVAGGTYIGSLLALPDAPTRAGYTFDGWFEAESGGTALTAPYTPALFADITLYAHWTPVVVAPQSKTLVIRGFAGGSHKLSRAMVARIKTFMSENSGFTAVSCTGFTEGPTILPVDKWLSRQRAVSVCSLVKRLSGGSISSASLNSVQKIVKSSYNRRVVIVLSK